jgi:y4mF family transcriptional regulator
MASEPQFFVWRSSADLADAIVNGRKALGLSQAALARRAGVGRRFVVELEHGKPTVRADKALAVLRAVELMPLVLPMTLISTLG